MSKGRNAVAFAAACGLLVGCATASTPVPGQADPRACWQYTSRHVAAGPEPDGDRHGDTCPYDLFARYRVETCVTTRPRIQARRAAMGIVSSDFLDAPTFWKRAVAGGGDVIVPSRRQSAYLASAACAKRARGRSQRHGDRDDRAFVWVGSGTESGGRVLSDWVRTRLCQRGRRLSTCRAAARTIRGTSTRDDASTSLWKQRSVAGCFNGKRPPEQRE